MAGAFTSAPSPAYKVSKAALNMLNAQWALRYKDAGFTFLCVSPGVCTCYCADNDMTVGLN